MTTRQKPALATEIDTTRSLRAWVTRRPLLSYVLLAYTFSWAWWLPMALTTTSTRAGLGWPTHLPGLMGAALAAIVVTGTVSGRDGLRDLGRRAWRWSVPFRWYALVLATAGLIVLAPLSHVITGEPLPAGSAYLSYSGIGALPGILTVLVVLVVNGFGEEIGWRGFLADGLLPRHGVVKAALLVAPVWALWHLPMFWVVTNLVELGIAGAVGWFIGLTAGSVLLTWLYQGSGRSIALVALWHAAFNMVTATEAGSGVAAAAASTLVMVAAVIIVVREWRRGRFTPRPTARS